MRRARRQNQAWRWWLKAIEARMASPIFGQQSWLVYLCWQLMVMKYQESSVTQGGGPCGSGLRTGRSTGIE